MKNLSRKKRIISKIIKFDENNQYGYAMTRPMPTGCIKQNNSPSWLEFNLLIEKVSLEDSIGHLFVVDIEFDEQNATKKQYMYNEIFPPIIEKQKILDANERSLFQLLELFDQVKVNQNHTGVQLNLMQLYFQKNVFLFILKI